jgi:hypothetical protein
MIYSVCCNHGAIVVSRITQPWNTSHEHNGQFSSSSVETIGAADKTSSRDFDVFSDPRVSHDLKGMSWDYLGMTE